MFFRAWWVGLVLAASALPADSTMDNFWTDLQSKREKLTSFHQEFIVAAVIGLAGEERQSRSFHLWVDGAGQKWRERALQGAGHWATVFDGVNEYTFTEGREEFVKTKPSAKDDPPLPRPYAIGRANWSKAVEEGREPCGVPGISHQCVWITVPLMSSVRSEPGWWGGFFPLVKFRFGKAKMKVDLETGLILALREVSRMAFQGTNPGDEAVDYESDVTFALERVAFGDAPEPSIYQLPASCTRQVAVLPHWDPARMNREWAGKPATELKLVDLSGKRFSLSAAKGKAVVLAFWATRCLSCRDDIARLDALAAKYSAQNLVLVGIVEDEERKAVEEFLSKRHLQFPNALTTENNTPPPYWVAFLPTYMVIDKGGVLVKAVQTAAEVPEVLKKAGVEVE